jgi:hypothetical protein
MYGGGSIFTELVRWKFDSLQQHACRNATYFRWLYHSCALEPLSKLSTGIRQMKSAYARCTSYQRCRHSGMAFFHADLWIYWFLPWFFFQMVIRAIGISLVVRQWQVRQCWGATVGGIFLAGAGFLVLGI